MGTITRNFANSISATSTLDTGVNFKNLLINGDMTVYQPAVTKTSITADEKQAGADRYNLRINARTAWAGTLANEPTFVPTNQGFKKALYVQTTTAETSVAAAEIVRIGQKIEANLLPHLKYGTANAQPLTFSFWVRSSVTGTFVSELWHRDHPSDTGHNSQSFTISSANTWEKKTVTFQGDTANGFNFDTGIGLECNIWLGAGTNYTSGGSTTGGAWSTDATKRAFGTSNDFINTLNANFYTTGWQLEIGEIATDFEFVPQDVNLRRCQRYFQTLGFGNIAMAEAGSTYVMNLPHIQTMRSAPSKSLNISSNLRVRQFGVGDRDASSPSISSSNGSATGSYIKVTGFNAIGSASTPAGIGYTTSSEDGNAFKLDSEL